MHPQEHACSASSLDKTGRFFRGRKKNLLCMLKCCSYAASVTRVKDHNWSCSIKYIQNEYIMQSCMLLSVLAGAWYCTASSSTMHHGCCMVLLHAPGSITNDTTRQFYFLNAPQKIISFLQRVQKKTVLQKKLNAITKKVSSQKKVFFF